MNCRTGAEPLLTFFFLCFTLSCICSAEASVSCYAVDHADHTAYYLNESVSESLEYSWRVDDVVVAHEGQFLNKSVVLEQGPRNMSLKACHEDVKYRNGFTGVDINCIHKCLAKQTTEDLPSAAAVAVVVPVAVTVGAVLLILILIAYCNREKLKRWLCVQVQRGGSFKSYGPTPQTV